MRDLRHGACWRCLHRLQSVHPSRPGLRRSISQGFLAKTYQAEEQWQEQAQIIRRGQKKSMLSILEERGFIQAIAGNRDSLDDLMTSKRIGAYVGVDPTAPSIHLGNLLTLMPLFWMFIHGFNTATVLGAATVKIGDPTDRLHTRPKTESHIRKANLASMHYQLKRLWANVELHARTHGYMWEWAWKRALVNNNEWLNKLSILEFLQILGPGARIGTMLGKETVRRRMEQGEGMSFAEFTYPLLQAWDWWHLYRSRRIQMQIGGADQYGNILAGIDALKYIKKNHPDPDLRQDKSDPLLEPCGFTVPLLTTAAGEKFGKSAGNAVWLSPEMMSAFDFYQFFLRLPDAEVSRYLKLFTFLPLSQIESVVTEHMKDPSQRRAQHALAREVVALVHGREEAQKAETQHRSLFTRPVSEPTSDDASQAAAAAGHPQSEPMPAHNTILPASLVYDCPPARVLYSAGLVSSRSEASRLLQHRGAYVGSLPSGRGGMTDTLSFTPIEAWTADEMKEYVIDGNLLILRVGKWKVKIVKIVSDEEYDRLGLDAPLWQKTKTQKAERAGRADDTTGLDGEAENRGAESVSGASRLAKSGYQVRLLKAAAPREPSGGSTHSNDGSGYSQDRRRSRPSLGSSRAQGWPPTRRVPSR